MIVFKLMGLLTLIHRFGKLIVSIKVLEKIIHLAYDKSIFSLFWNTYTFYLLSV